MKVLRHVHLRHVYGEPFFLFMKTYIQVQKHYGIKLLCGPFFRILFSFLSFSAVFLCVSNTRRLFTVSLRVSVSVPVISIFCKLVK